MVGVEATLSGPGASWGDTGPPGSERVQGPRDVFDLRFALGVFAEQLLFEKPVAFGLGERRLFVSVFGEIVFQLVQLFRFTGVHNPA